MDHYLLETRIGWSCAIVGCENPHTAKVDSAKELCHRWQEIGNQICHVYFPVLDLTSCNLTADSAGRSPVWRNTGQTLADHTHSPIPDILHPDMVPVHLGIRQEIDLVEGCESTPIGVPYLQAAFDDSESRLNCQVSAYGGWQLYSEVH